MNLQDRYDTLKLAVVAALNNLERNTAGMTAEQKLAYLDLWIESSRGWMDRLENREESHD